MMLKTRILLESQQVPETGKLILRVDQVVDIEISCEEAQRLVSVFVLTEIGNLLHGEAPTLVIGDRTVWRVPVHLTRPSYGDLGQVGAIDVDVSTGELYYSSQSIRSIESNARDLVSRLSPQTAPAIG
jgi:hypothetical protein